MVASLVSVRSLLLSIFMLMAGSGFLSTLMSLRLEATGTTQLLIGLIGTAYFAGLTLGALRAGRIIERVGHIRAFTAFVSLFSASTLACTIWQDFSFWAVLRFVEGISLAGVFICIESWLNERATPQTRGAILAFYMVALYAGQGAGQFLLDLGNRAPALPFIAASILLSLAVIPIALTRLPGPVLGVSTPLSFLRLYRISPLGIFGAAMTGVMLGGFYALGAIYAHGLGMARSQTALFMSVVIMGGVVLQVPIGRLSDRFDRRKVIIGTFAGAGIVSVILGAPIWPPGVVDALGLLFGGLVFTLYPLCVAHTNDFLDPEQRVGASGGLVLVYSIGAAIGPVIAAIAMTRTGPGGLFIFLALAALAAVGFGVWRQRVREPVPNEQQQPYQILTRTTPIVATLDPNTPEEG
ncbi:unnamed protein product [Acidocella sp. C78]|uniref:MFS transporter n=1 Tax=Acidocella sp. C78 TaxID=1671486 RepID=UPI00191BB76E|nr:MFS transporter [Acidocella sp. C78]CAG4905832.1 unnamed protein product [Acidocella sp. C78]